ncbi:septum site-determining protein MinC [Methyloceanibacter sp.]|uniref:septum site-determining protein MinC n=1 Tax=Methyloceanibacter sp. TaxID=1965321 RepID=UPI003D6CCC8E
MSTARPSFKFRGGSFHALVVRPEAPIDAWLAEVDALLARSPGFFAGKSVVIDVSGLSLTKQTFLGLLDELSRRDMRILGVEGANPADVDGRVPSLVRGQAGKSDAAGAPPVQLPAPEPVSSLLIDAPVRSGQAIVHPDGDVTIVGSVASGAEIIAAGSIHVYGTLRGRVLAGAYGNQRARIFCRRLDAELIAIDGHYIVADEVEPHLRKAPIQAWLEGDELKIITMN